GPRGMRWSRQPRSRGRSSARGRGSPTCPRPVSRLPIRSRRHLHRDRREDRLRQAGLGALDRLAIFGRRKIAFVSPMATTWIPSAGDAGDDYEDIRYEKSAAPDQGIAKITIARPEVRNAFRPRTIIEISRALEDAREDTAIGVIVLTGEGPDAFCSGGDQRVRGDSGYLEDGAAGKAAVGRFHVTDLHVQIRRLPKPVVAMVAGYAIGGGQVLHLVCDLTIAAENARFGQV